jgi:hypothetical protein
MPAELPVSLCHEFQESICTIDTWHGGSPRADVG